MMEEQTGAGKLDLSGGRLCLDFANTAGMHASEEPKEYLKTYHDLVEWSHHAGILSNKEAKNLDQKAVKSPAEADSVLKRAIELREALYRLFVSIGDVTQPQKRDLAVLNKNLSDTMAQSRLVPTETGYVWDTSGDKDKLDGMLHPVVRSAADLLTSGELDRIKQCADEQGCGWMFFDTSRNRSRRWCDMSDCGNRAKARRFYSHKRKKHSC
jgi:predicted RNA-binding Zn ribbon-like protein